MLLKLCNALQSHCIRCQKLIINRNSNSNRPIVSEFQLVKSAKLNITYCLFWSDESRHSIVRCAMTVSFNLNTDRSIGWMKIGPLFSVWCLKTLEWSGPQIWWVGWWAGVKKLVEVRGERAGNRAGSGSHRNRFEQRADILPLPLHSAHMLCSWMLILTYVLFIHSLVWAIMCSWHLPFIVICGNYKLCCKNLLLCRNILVKPTKTDKFIWRHWQLMKLRKKLLSVVCAFSDEIHTVRYNNRSLCSHRLM